MWAQSPDKPTISTVSKSPRGALFVTLGDFQNPSHHQSILDGPSIVPDTSSNLRETSRAVQRTGRAIGLSHFKKSRPNSASSELDQNRIEHLSSQALSTEARVDRDIQNLGVLPN